MPNPNYQIEYVSPIDELEEYGLSVERTSDRKRAATLLFSEHATVMCRLKVEVCRGSDLEYVAMRDCVSKMPEQLKFWCSVEIGVLCEQLTQLKNHRSEP